MIITPKSRFLRDNAVRVNGLEMFARMSLSPADRNRDTPIICIHGYGVSGRYMIPLADELAGDFTVYVPDFPGFGRSEKPAYAFDVPELVEALLRWMDLMHIQNAIMVGNSFGCQIIVEFAVRYPERISRAVLIGPTVDPQARSVFQQVYRLTVDIFREKIRLVVIAAYDYLIAGPVRMLQTLKYLLRYDTKANLTRVGVPTLIIVGSRDPIVPLKWAREAALLLPEGRLAILAGVSHATNFDAAALTAELIRTFLNDTRTYPRDQAQGSLEKRTEDLTDQNAFGN